MKYLKVLFLALGLLPLSALAMDSNELDVKLQQVINQYSSDNQKVMGFSGIEMSVLLPNESEPRHYVVGAQSKDQNTPATTEMMVQYGSITKEYTSTLLIQLANQHKLSLDDSVRKLLPEKFDSHSPESWPLHWGDATVAQLLNMTSGIPVSVNNPDIAKKLDYYHVYAPIDIINMAVNYENVHGCDLEQGCFNPGAQYFYSNTNYMIAGLIIEKYAHDSFSNLITKNILGKVSSNSLYYILDPLPDDLLARMFHGYYEGDSGVISQLPNGQDVSAMSLSWGNSAGALIGTTDALTKMTHALFFDNKFNSSELLTSIKYLIQTSKTTSGQPVTDIPSQCANDGCYGLGTAVLYDPQWGNIWFYEGGTLGFSTYYMWLPKENVTLAISQNGIGNGDNLAPVLVAANQFILQYLLNNNTRS